MVPEIDIVMPWVDGDDPAHVSKRLRHSALSETSISKRDDIFERKSEIRWRQHNEINFSLRTIACFAPWIRKVFIVTDSQTPDLGNLPVEFLKKIEIVDHFTLFKGYEDVLPTFNSATIGTTFWRIEGLAENFIIFNDDVFITKPITPAHFFVDQVALLRGKYESFESRSGEREGWFHHLMNGARLAGITGDRFLHLAHVCQPLKRSLLSEFFSKNPEHFERNISFRFRDKSQFNLSSLGAHLSIVAEQAMLRTAGSEQDWHVIANGLIKRRAPYYVRRQLMKLRNEQCYLGCLNDFGECERKVPRTREYLNSLLKGYE